MIGGHVYRGRRRARLAFGTYVATDYCSGNAWAVRKNRDGTYSSAAIGQFPRQVSLFAPDRSGELYAVTDRADRLRRVGGFMASSVAGECAQDSSSGVGAPRYLLAR